MSKIKQIGVPNPCQKEQWANMDEVARGRYCDSCNKTVVDFTAMDTEQIIEVLSDGDRLCGSFAYQQLELINSSVEIQKTGSSLWRHLAVAAAILLCAVPFYNTDARGKQTTIQPFKKNRTGQISAADIVKTITITGKVTDTTNDGLNGAIIQTLDKKYKTTADSLGEFRLIIPDTIRAFQVGFIGFLSVEININSKPDHRYNVILKVAPRTIGEVIIKRN